MSLIGLVTVIGHLIRQVVTYHWPGVSRFKSVSGRLTGHVVNNLWSY